MITKTSATQFISTPVQVHYDVQNNIFKQLSKFYWQYYKAIDSLTPVHSPSGNVSDDTSKADNFKSVFTVEDLTGLDDLKSSISFLSPILDTITFTPEDVYQQLIKLNPLKACGLDLLHSSLLKEAAEFKCI